jgi:hypothetical protein
MADRVRCVLSTSTLVQATSPRELLPAHTKAYHKARERVGDFLAMYTRHIQVYIKSEVISSMSTFFNMAESHIGYATFGDEVDRSMTHLKESLVENILRAVRQVFLAKHSSSGKVKNSDDTSETIQSSHAFDSRNMNRNLDLHVMEEGEELSIVVCEELSCYVY